MDSRRAGVLWRHYWPVDLLAVVFLVVVLIFGEYLNHRSQVAERHSEQVRRALCAILDRIPPGKDAGIDRARVVAGCGRVRPPTVFFGTPHPTRTVIVSPSPVPVPAGSGPTVAPAPAPRPSPSRTASPRPTHQPTPRPIHTPHPTPSPSGICLPLLPRCLP